MSKRKGVGVTRRLVAIPPGPIHASAPLSCLKVAYANEAEADAARVGWKQGASYKCKLCGAWHTTRNPKFKQML